MAATALRMRPRSASAMKWRPAPGICSINFRRAGRTIRKILSEIRGNQQAAQEQNPTSYMAGQGWRRGRTGLWLLVGAGILPMQRRLAGVLGGAATGATYGGLHGPRLGEGIGDRLKQAGIEGHRRGGSPVEPSCLSRWRFQSLRDDQDALVGRQAAQQAGTSPEVLDARQRHGRGRHAWPGWRGQNGQGRQDAMLADAVPNARSIPDTAIQRGGPAASRRGRQSQTEPLARRAPSRMRWTILAQPEGLMSARNAIRISRREREVQRL